MASKKQIRRYLLAFCFIIAIKGALSVILALIIMLAHWHEVDKYESIVIVWGATGLIEWAISALIKMIHDSLK